MLAIYTRSLSHTARSACTGPNAFSSAIALRFDFIVFTLECEVKRNESVVNVRLA